MFLKTMTKRFRITNEYPAYLILWLITFLTPILSMYVRTTLDSSFNFHWGIILNIWKVYSLFLAVFFLHDLFLAPLLIFRRKKTLYFTGTAIIVIIFAIYQCSIRPDRPGLGERGFHSPRQEKAEDFRREQPPHDMDMRDMPPHDMPPRDMHRPEAKPPVIIGEHDVVRCIILVLLLGMNLGVKYYFKSQRDHQLMKQLEHDHLAQQLEYLKYQINPHFFMNTLNNIHALVDINPEQAKRSIVILSKMMRYLLYESNHEMIPLSKEISFINNYISLMRMRYTEKVQVNTDLPDSPSATASDGEIPPLLLITFVENAFKHGVSYQHDTRIDISARTEDGRLLFCCSNTKKEEGGMLKEEGGVGLKNVRRRLDIIYQDQYSLQTEEDDQLYSVRLSLPLSASHTPKAS